MTQQVPIEFKVIPLVQWEQVQKVLMACATALGGSVVVDSRVADDALHSGILQISENKGVITMQLLSGKPNA